MGMKTHRLRIGVSSCLLGQEVRWDGAHKRDAWLSDILGRYVEWTAVCPEVDMGLPAPREPMNLVRRNGKIHLTAAGKTDPGRQLRAFAAGRADELGGISGYVLKSRSPSCGVAGVRVYDSRGRVARNGRGLFAEALMRRWPLLPVEEESGLACPRRRENFIRRIFTYHRRQVMMASSAAPPQALRRFHERHRCLIMAHSRAALARLERMTSAAEYFRLLFCTLARTPSIRNQVYVLSHLTGQLGCRSRETKRIDKAIEAYRRNLAPLASPLGLIRRCADKATALRDQVYLYPHPDEWELLKDDT